MGLIVGHMAFVPESEITMLLRRSSDNREEGAFGKLKWFASDKNLVHGLLDYRSCGTDRCICIGCIGLDPPLAKLLTVVEIRSEPVKFKTIHTILFMFLQKNVVVHRVKCFL